MKELFNDTKTTFSFWISRLSIPIGFVAGLIVAVFLPNTINTDLALSIFFISFLAVSFLYTLLFIFSFLFSVFGNLTANKN